MSMNKKKKIIGSGDVISYMEMCSEEGVNLQRGMNFRLRGKDSVILMSVRPGAPYNDRVENKGAILIYEGHDVPNKTGGPDPKKVDQPMKNPLGSFTQNGLFYQAAKKFKEGKCPAEKVKVYEKIKSGIWVYNGVFKLRDVYLKSDNFRKVFKFKLELEEKFDESLERSEIDLEHNRMIPSSVKLEVWKRDKGKCIQCGKTDNLHFDHVIPFSKGGSSLKAGNIQILCARHNFEKRDKIK